MRQLQEMALRHESEQLGQLSNRNGHVGFWCSLRPKG